LTASDYAELSKAVKDMDKRFAIKVTIICAALITLAGNARAQAAPQTEVPQHTQFKGVYIGESAADVFAPVLAVLGTQDAWDKCIAQQNDRDKQQRNAKGKCGEWFTQTKQQINDMISGKNGTFPSPSNTNCMTITYAFTAGKLSSVNVSFFPCAETSFSDQVDNLATKYGKPGKVEDIPYQNGFGAQFIGHRATWVMQDKTNILCDVKPDPKAYFDTVFVRFYNITAEDVARTDSERRAANPY
jgi:hypothetical protein